MAPLTPSVLRLFALDRRLIVSSAALLTSLILVNKETLVQARLLPAILSASGVIINGLGAGAVGGGGNPSLSPGRATGTVPSSVVSASIPLSPGRGLYLPMQSQASYRSASSSPSARRPSSGFDVHNEEADARENIVVADGRADVRASAAMTDDNDDDADNGNFDDTLGEIVGASFKVTPSFRP